ncbi:hypothetical protein ALC62_04000, partial [Cyphomyrmex costatus]
RVFTCGLCEEIVEIVESHPCVVDYAEVIFDENLYFYPQCDNGDIVRRSNVNGENINVVENSQFPSKGPQGVTPESNADEILIAEVFLREPLWNQNIAIARRGRRTMDKLWQEVSEATKGVYSSEECKRKWKNLRDRFMRIVSAEKLPSGAASQSKKNKWRFYESLNFLRDTLLRRDILTTINCDSKIINNCYCYFRTVSNIPVCNNMNVEDEEEESAQDDTPKNSKKQRVNRNSNQDSVILEQISEALHEPPPTISLPSIPVADEEEHFGMMISSQLRKFSRSRRRQLMFKIHKMLYKELNKDEQ